METSKKVAYKGWESKKHLKKLKIPTISIIESPSNQWIDNAW